MNRPLTRVLALGVLTATLPLHAAEDPGIALPPVPREVLLAANDTTMPIRHVSAQVSDGAAPDDEDASASALSLGPRTIRVSPGTTAIVEVAIDHLNRLVTPFVSPQVRTVSPATTQVDGSAVYVATASEDPVSLFITEAGDTATAISLTLAPRHIPPREVRLVLTGGVVRAPAPTVTPPERRGARRPTLRRAHRRRVARPGPEPGARRLRPAQGRTRGARRLPPAGAVGLHRPGPGGPGAAPPRGPRPQPGQGAGRAGGGALHGRCRLGGGRGRRLAPVASRPRRGDRALSSPCARASRTPATSPRSWVRSHESQGPLGGTLADPAPRPGARRRARGRAGPGRAPGHRPQGRARERSGGAPAPDHQPADRCRPPRHRHRGPGRAAAPAGDPHGSAHRQPRQARPRQGGGPGARRPDRGPAPGERP